MVHFEPIQAELKKILFYADKELVKKKFSSLFLFLLSGGITSCLGGGGTSVRETAVEGLQYSGSIVISSHLTGASTLGLSNTISKFEISAPIFPKMNELSRYEGSDYPSTTEGVVGAVENISITFANLLSECKVFYPTIVLSSDKQNLTAEDLSSNYNLVAQCSYERFSSKPYWIPQLINDVDVCMVVMGSSWRLLTQMDLNKLLPSQLQYFEQTLSTVKGVSSGFWGDFYFGLKTYAKGEDSLLKIGDLSSAASQKVSDLGLDESAMKNHYEGTSGPVGIRCRRVLE